MHDEDDDQAEAWTMEELADLVREVVRRAFLEMEPEKPAQTVADSVGRRARNERVFREALGEILGLCEYGLAVDFYASHRIGDRPPESRLRALLEGGKLDGKLFPSSPGTTLNFFHNGTYVRTPRAKFLNTGELVGIWEAEADEPDRDTIRHDAQVSAEQSRPLGPSPLFEIDEGNEIDLDKVIGWKADNPGSPIVASTERGSIMVPLHLRHLFVPAWREWVTRPRGQA